LRPALWVSPAGNIPLADGLLAAELEPYFNVFEKGKQFFDASFFVLNFARITSGVLLDRAERAVAAASHQSR